MMPKKKDGPTLRSFKFTAEDQALLDEVRELMAADRREGTATAAVRYGLWAAKRELSRRAKKSAESG